MILGGELAKNFPKGGNILPKSTLPEGGGDILQTPLGLPAYENISFCQYIRVVSALGPKIFGIVNLTNKLANLSKFCDFAISPIVCGVKGRSVKEFDLLFSNNREECSNKGGTNGGSCASGFGVCCVFSGNFEAQLIWPFTVLTPYLIPNQLYQIVLSVLKQQFCKIAKNTQAEQRNVYTFLVALKRYQTWAMASKQ